MMLTQKFRVIPASIQMFGVSWWADQWQGEGDLKADGRGEFHVTPQPGWTHTRSEWWRWLGYYALATPLDWLIWHVQRKHEPQ